MGAGDQRLQSGQVNVDDPVVFGVGIAGEGNIVRFPALGSQEAISHFVRGEDGSGSAQLSTHVGNGGALGDRQGGDAGAAPLDDGAHAALDGQDPEKFQRDILGGDIGTELAGQVDLEHLGHIDVVSTAAHGHGHIHAAGAEGQHTQTAAGGGVAVGADEGLAGLAEPLQVDLVADAVAGTGEVHAVLGGHGLQVTVVVGVFVTALEGVMVHIGYAQLGLDLGDAHGLKFQVGHGAGGVLGQSLVDLQGDLTAHGHIACHQMGGDDLLRDSLTHCV